MSSSESLALIYGRLADVEGPATARETVSSILYSAIIEIQADGFNVTSDQLDEKLQKVAEKFIHAARKDVA